ncbi:MAG: hypothetical protein ACE5HE_14190, partial [Phycisphaerae bacterium]
MPSRYLVAPALVLFWLLVGAAFVWAGQRQSERVNLSAAAGGQYPYLTYAWRIAESGLGEWRGDRNRMPLYPLLLSTVGDGDWNTFVERSTSFAITSSAAALAVIGVLSYWGLSVWPATVLTLAAAVCIFIYKASFVQAELLYYALFYAAWLVLCRLLHGPSVLWGLAGGLCVGLAYLTKASGMAILLPYLAAAGVQIVALLFARRPAVLADLAAQDRRRCLAVLRSAVIAGLGFLVVVYPYISSNKSRFGRYFYNVNTSFFMWCDSWPEAKSFADKYQITDHYPDAPPDAVPGPLAYWRQHTMGRIAHRLGYGVITLASIAADQPIFKYLVATLAFCVFFGMKEKRRLRELWSEYWCTALFCVLGFGGYLAVFAWYAVVAYGGRFVLSLLLPAMFVLLWLCERIGQVARPVLLLGYRVRKSTAFWIIMLVFLLGEG